MIDRVFECMKKSSDFTLGDSFGVMDANCGCLQYVKLSGILISNLNRNI